MDILTFNNNKSLMQSRTNNFEHLKFKFFPHWVFSRKLTNSHQSIFLFYYNSETKN